MESDNHYYAEGYSPENDPYVMENGVLINKLGLSDTQTLNLIELRITSLEVERLLSASVPATFNVQYLRDLHYQIFQKVYPWAGELRKVDIGKGDTQFLTHSKIESELNMLFAELANNQFLTGATHENFSQKVGEYLVHLNFIHPFREGNGRTQRLLISRIAQNAGITLDWRAVSNDAMRKACIDGINGNTRNMVRLILLNSKK